jgi:hypothetical protein
MIDIKENTLIEIVIEKTGHKVSSKRQSAILN